MNEPRDINFRAWDNIAKKMHYSKIEQFDDMLGFRFEHFETDKPIYMQYTDLKDKNGKEIYEGDIVKWVIPKGTVNPNVKFDPLAPIIGVEIGEISDDCEFISKIYWNSALGCWSLETDEYHKCMINGAIKRSQMMEVIGNIYENPELLEKK